MNFCLVYLRSRLPCILGRPLEIQNHRLMFWDLAHGGARVLKCFLLPSSTLSKNTFSSEGNGRDFLTSSTSSRLSSKSCACRSVTDGLTMMCVCWTDRLTGIFCIANLRSLGEITDCRQNHDQPSIFAAPWAERLHYRPTTNWCPSDTLVEW